MKRNLVKIGVTAITAIVLTLCFIPCNNCTTQKSTDKTSKPVNITVFLDLSDRLVRELTPSQKERDIAIIQNVGDYFVKACTNSNQLLKSTNRFQVLFYPTPNSSEINTHAEKLKLDLSNLDPANKKKALVDFRNNLVPTTNAIYAEVLKTKNWTGCDIWRFFSDKRVDEYCIKKGYRNILIILTDGYLYEETDRIQKGNAYSYILPQTLKVAGSSLIVERKGLQDIEVLMLEINPYDIKDRNKIIQVLQTWFTEMQVAKFVVADTDLPDNTKQVISNFLNADEK